MLGEESSFETAVSGLFDGCDMVCEDRAVTTIHSFEVGFLVCIYTLQRSEVVE